MRYFKNQLKAPGRRLAAPPEPSADKFAQYDRYSGFQKVEQALGRRAKRVIDMARTSQDYYRIKEVHSPTLDHYENSDWWERETAYDFYAYMDERK